ncbi:MAG: hypothetical protein AB1714_00600 [Acidobacteriota bacterium]
MNAKGESSSPPARRAGSVSTVVRSALAVLLLLAMSATADRAACQECSGKIAFASNRDGNYEIYAMEADGSGVMRLTYNSAYDRYPAWSPDCSKIAFVSTRDGNAEIYLMDADGSDHSRLTNHVSEDLCPCWSPDGSMIAFLSYRDGNGEVYVMDSDGSHPRNLTNSTAGEGCPEWSPDGLLIAFPRDVGAAAGRIDIYVMNSSDGTGQAPLITGPGHDDDPAYSPDGALIAFPSDRDAGLFKPDIYRAKADGSNVIRLTANLAIDCFPTWSPDGSKIAFYSNRDGNGEIYEMDAHDGSDQENLTKNSAEDTMPDWQSLSIPPNNPPVAVCKDAQVSADENCEATIAAGDIDGGSYDPDGDDITLSLDDTGPFPLGEHPVTLTVTEEHGESDSCHATVRVVDNTVPAPTLTDPICVTVGKGKKTANKLTAGASDNCTQSSTVSIDNVQVFNNGGNPVHGNGVYDIIRNDIYVYPNGHEWSVEVTLTATDEAGNGATSTITRPLLKCK